jgi:hypothetical protein
LHGLGHPHTLKALYDVAHVILKQGKSEEAEVSLRRVFEGLHEIVGPSHIYLFSVTGDLGIAMLQQHRLEEAEQLLKRAFEGWEKIVAPRVSINCATL